MLPLYAKLKRGFAVWAISFVRPLFPSVVREMLSGGRRRLRERLRKAVREAGCTILAKWWATWTFFGSSIFHLQTWRREWWVLRIAGARLLIHRTGA